MRVVVGSLNPTKIAAVRAVFERAWPDETRVEGQKVTMPSSVSNMPVDDNVRRGARYRAHAVLSNDVDFAVGAEGGVRFIHGQGYLFNWCVVADTQGRLYESPSPFVLLPYELAQRVRAGEELGPLIDEMVKDKRNNAFDGAVSVLTRGLLSRQHFFEQALTCAIAPLLTPSFYEGLTRNNVHEE